MDIPQNGLWVEYETETEHGETHSWQSSDFPIEVKNVNLSK